MGVEVSHFATLGRQMTIRCVDYGILLDVAPVTSALSVGSSTTGNALVSIIQAIAGSAPLGGITATSYYPGWPGRVAVRIDESVLGQLYSVPIATGTSEVIDAGTMVLTALERYSGIAEDPYAIAPRPADVYVTPLKQLAVRPSDKSFGAAPYTLCPPTGGLGAPIQMSAEEIARDTDWRTLETGVYVEDSDRVEPGVFYHTDPIDSGWYYGTVNGYTVMPSRIGAPLPDESQIAIEAGIYLEKHGETIVGTATVTAEVNAVTPILFVPGELLSVAYPVVGLDGDYIIHAVQTRFQSGTGIRRTTIQFNGERGTVARFNRTRFARAGVMT